MVLQYGLVIFLVISRQLGPAMLIVFLTIPRFIKLYRVFSKPRPEQPPTEYDKQAWPLYLVHHAFKFTRIFGLLFLLGLIIDVA